MTRFFALAASLFLLGCTSAADSLVGAVNPYRADVRQGNYVDAEMLARLRPGMSRDQVRFVLGSPLVTDLFRPDRWDYVYRFQPGRGSPEQRVIRVIFANDQLDRVEGDVDALAKSGEGELEASQRNRVIEIEARP